jgi:pimeloyl-ACP methyl ester carboxylesterase
MQANPGRFQYQILFQSDSARDLLEKDFEQTVRVTFRASTDEHVKGSDLDFQSQLYGWEKVNGIKDSSSLKTGQSGTTSLSKMLTPADLAVYVSQFRQSGFLNPLRWYRNVERNWKWNQKVKGSKVTVPALMVTAENDYILTPSMTNGMDKHIDQLKLVHVEESSHWIMQQQPAKCSKILCDWLLSLSSTSIFSSKL